MFHVPRLNHSRISQIVTYTALSVLKWLLRVACVHKWVLEVSVAYKAGLKVGEMADEEI